MIAALLIAAALIPLGSIAYDMWRDSRRTLPTVVVAKPYEAPFRYHGGELARRPEGRAALKAEIAQSHHVELVPAPPVNLRVRKRPNWDFDTDHHRAVYANWSDSLPDGLAVQREWVGTGVTR